MGDQISEMRQMLQTLNGKQVALNLVVEYSNNPTGSVCRGEVIVALRQQGIFLRDLITDKLLLSPNAVDLPNLLALTNHAIIF